MEALGVPPEWALVLVFGLAVGLDLYLVVLTLVLLAHAPGIPAAPGQLASLSGPWIAAAAAAFYYLGWTMERSRRRILVWEAFHLPVKMVAAGLLVALLLPGRSGAAIWVPAVVGAGMAGGVHAVRVGWGTILDHRMGRGPGRRLRAIIEDGLAVGIVGVSILGGPYAGGAAALALLLVLGGSAGPALRAVRFTPHLLGGLARRALGISELLPMDRLPRWIPRTMSTRAGREVTGLRGIRAALLGVPDGGIFRAGWFIQGPEGPVFMYRTFGGVWEVNLFQGQAYGVRMREDLLRVDWRDPDGRFAVLLPRSAPEGEFRFPGVPHPPG